MDKIISRVIPRDQVPKEILALAEGLISSCSNVITVEQLEQQKEEDAE